MHCKNNVEGRPANKTNSAKALSRETFSHFFYMPMKQAAAKEFNTGITILKKRCRGLGIHRRPYRKLASLQILINNLQGGEVSEGRRKEAIQILEERKKRIEEMPDMQLEDTTKKLRQAWFKSKHKKRKLVKMMESRSSSRADVSRASDSDDDDKEEVCSSLSDFAALSNGIF
ncbi:hypothetical protein NMG60_11009624 [Bertholletia excelsa]